MSENVQLEVLTGRGETLRLHVGRQRTVGEVLETLRSVVSGFEDRRLEFYYGNSKLKPDYTIEFFVQAYGAGRDGPVAIRLEDFAEGNGKPAPAADPEIVLFEEAVDPRRPSPPAPRIAEPAPRPATRRFRENDRSYRVRIERPAVLRLGTNHRLRVHVRALGTLPSERTIEIQPRYPGCLVVPERAAQPASGEATHEFLVTPMAAGPLPGATIRLAVPAGRSVDLPAPARVRSAAPGKWLAALALVLAALERTDPRALLAAAALAALALAALAWSRPRPSPPREETVIL